MPDAQLCKPSYSLLLRALTMHLLIQFMPGALPTLFAFAMYLDNDFIPYGDWMGVASPFRIFLHTTLIPFETLGE
jgi:hypothetical protein